MSACDAAQGKLIVKPEGVPVSLGKLKRKAYRALVSKRNQARVERGVQVSGEKQTVVHVETFGVVSHLAHRLM